MSIIQIASDLTRDTAGLGNEAVYALGPGPTYGPATLIVSPVTEKAVQLIASSNTFGIFTYQGQSYVLASKSVSNKTSMFKSAANDLAWTELDAANAPPQQNGSGYFDGNHTVIVAFADGPGQNGPVKLKNFDLSAGTWGPTYGTVGGPTSAHGVATVWQRPDGSIFVLYQDRTALPGDGSSGLGAAVFSSGAWGASFDPGANILTLPGWDASQTVCFATQSTSAMESSGVIDLFFTTSSAQVVPVVWLNRCFYQKINLDLSLGTFLDFPGQSVRVGGHQDLEAFSGSPLGRPLILPAQNLIALPVLMYNRAGIHDPLEIPRMYIGTPISAPVWSVDTTKTIDPGISNPLAVWDQEWGSTAFDGSTIYVVAAGTFDTAPSNLYQVRLLQSSNLGSPADGWSARTVQAITDLPANLQVANQSFRLPSVIAAPVSVSSTVFIGGSSAGRVRCCPPGKVKQLMEAGEALREMLKGTECWPWEHLIPPPESVPVNLIGDIVAPAPVPNLRIPILSYTVPAGMMLYLMAILEDVETGTFTPGDALWTVDQNAGGSSMQAAGVQGLIATPVPLGSVTSGRWWPFNRSYEFPEWTLLRSTIQNVNVPQGAPNYFVSGFLGYLVPVKR